MKILDGLHKYLYFMPIIVIIVFFDKNLHCKSICETQGSDSAVADDSRQRCDTVSSGERFSMF
jgi:hypothetical protein